MQLKRMNGTSDDDEVCLRYYHAHSTITITSTIIIIVSVSSIAFLV